MDVLKRSAVAVALPGQGMAEQIGFHPLGPGGFSRRHPIFKAVTEPVERMLWRLEQPVLAQELVDDRAQLVLSEVCREHLIPSGASAM